MPADVLSAPFRALAADLPIFRREMAGDVLFYAPGYVVVADHQAADELERELLSGACSSAAAADLVRYGAAALRAWADRMARSYAPVCLTLYPNHACNLACTYCFSEPADASARLSMETVQTAARLVAANCRTRGLPLTLVLHGGGEPSLNRRHADMLLDAVETAAAETGVPVFRYIATNGVMSAGKVRWLAQRFDLIGLSCDGPPDVQGQQRPLPGGASSALYVERTARTLHEVGARLHVRVTVTPATLYRQVEIADYVCRVLRPEEIHVEPVYPVGRAAIGVRFDVAQAAAFTAEFWHARAAAQAFGVQWLATGSRPDEVHGAYCQVFRDVLQLVPGNAASACLRVSRAEAAQAAGVQVGTAAGKSFELNPAQAAAVRDRLNQEAPACNTCFNRYHCARGCPASCPLDGDMPDAFRCQVQQRLTLAYIDETVRQLRARYRAIAGTPVHFRQMRPS